MAVEDPTATRTEGPLSPAAVDAQERLEAAIAEYDRQLAAFESAKGAGKTKESQSHSAKMSIQSFRIADAELDLAIEGVEYEPWVKPVTSSKASRKTPMSVQEIETKLAKAVAVYNDPTMPDSTVTTADQRITALLKSAKARGFKVSDPR